ncbi:zinc-ribbon domain-containing protein [Methanoregula sp.]|uniref:zinc ribbon domain-containing protein n=1 Tax=Methanoregula sp. TaxID=2052170 RepID=UPI0035646936
MGNHFCTACGEALSDGVKFCEHCGAPVDMDASSLDLPGSSWELPPKEFRQPSEGSPKKLPVAVLAGIIVVLVVAAVLALVVLPGVSKNIPTEIPETPAPAVTTMIPDTPAPVLTTRTPRPDPYPGALRIKDSFPFGSGEVASQGTVYRVWMNSTYHWHNDMDNRYYTQKPHAGNKYLIIFVNVYNNGTTRVWPPAAGTIKVHYEGTGYSMDSTHYLPNKAYDRKATPIEVQEIQYYPKLFGSEYVEDYGYSHGDQTAYLYPGKSNAIDGYIIYEVPESLTLDRAYARIAFNGADVGVWKLG